MSVKFGKTEDRTVEGALRALAGEATTLSLGTAIGILADHAAGDADPTQRTKATRGLTETLAKHADPQVRVGAASALGTAGSAAALRALRSVVDSTDDGELMAAAAQGLARSGTKSDIARILKGSTRTGWEPGQRRARAAARILSHRIGEALDATDAAVRLPGEDAGVLPRPRRGAKIQPVDITQVVDRVRIRPSEAHLLPERAKVVGAFSCGPRQHIVMAPTRPADLEQLAKAPALAATLMGVNETTGETFVRWVVLTRPATPDDGPGRGGPGDLVVTVTRATGEVGFIGRGRLEGGALRVEIASVDAPGASALDMTGTLIAGQITIEGVSDQRITVPRLVPSAAPGTSTG